MDFDAFEGPCGASLNLEKQKNARSTVSPLICQREGFKIACMVQLRISICS